MSWKELRVYLVQLEARRDKEESAKAVERLLSRIEGPGLAVLPEYSMFDPTGLEPGVVSGAAEPLEGPWLARIRRIARDKGLCVVVGVFEKGPRGKPYNSVVAVGEDGEIVGFRRKYFLFDALGYRESSVFEAGEDPYSGLMNLCGVPTGVAVCFELRFPEVFRRHALGGAEVFVVPSAWYRGPGKEEQYRFLAQARAHENTAWLLAPILYGANFTVGSLIVKPYGMVEVDAGQGERVVDYTIERRILEEARERLPLLQILSERLPEA